MKIIPGAAFLNAVSGAAARPVQPQPGLDPQSRTNVDAVKPSGRSFSPHNQQPQKAAPASDAAGPVPSAPSRAVPANAPRGSFVNLLV